jgi:hypothetical protein
MSYHVLRTRFSLLSRLDIKMFITTFLLLALLVIVVILILILILQSAILQCPLKSVLETAAQFEILKT